MRKLDTKNKTFIFALSTLAFVAIGAIIVFIVIKIGKTTIKYDVKSGTFVFNASGELVTIKEDTYAKKNVLDKYYVMLDGKKEYVGSKPVFYREAAREIKLLGTFYEVGKSGEVTKYSGETIIDNLGSSRLFKIADRKYLIVSSVIRSEDNSLHTNDYLLIDIDKAGNAYLYNNNVNIKTFTDLELITDDFHFDVSREYLIINNEKIDLAKVNGSTNEHSRETTEPGSGEGGNGSGNGGGNDSGNGGEGGNGTGENGNGNGSGEGGGNGGGQQVDPIIPKNTIIEQEIIQKYIARKTTVTGIEATEKDIKVNYVIYDPFSEYDSVYVNVYTNGELVGKYDLGINSTSHLITGLKAHTKYNLEFYYSYTNDSGELVTVKFDSASVVTKNIKASLSLEKTSDSVVRYILIVEGGYRLDSATVEMYIDDTKVGSDVVNTSQAASASGYNGSITFEGTGDFVTLKLTNCIYDGESIDIEASYKYKL